MNWDDRGSLRVTHTVLRETAHSDEAKPRLDESSQLPLRGRGLVAGAGVAVILAATAGAAATLVASKGGRPAAAPPFEAVPRTAVLASDGPQASPSAAPSSTTSARPVPSGPLEFDTRGTLRFVLTQPGSSRRATLPLKMNVACTPDTCRLTSELNFMPGIFDRALPRTGPSTWSAPGRAPKPRCRRDDDDGLAATKLVLTVGGVRLVVSREYRKWSNGTCVSIYSGVRGTFEGPRR